MARGGNHVKHLLLALLTAPLLAIAAVASAAPPAAAVGDIDVMTQNQYIGADLLPLIQKFEKFGTDEFNNAVVSVIETIAANRTGPRVNSLAREIAARKPHLVGLQEVWYVDCIPAVPKLGGYPCNDPKIADAWGDHLTLTMNSLGSAYAVAARVENFKLVSFGPYPGIPFYYNNVPAYLQVIDRDVILARSNVSASVFKDYPCAKPSLDGCNYQVDLPLAKLETSIKRGFVMVDANVNGKTYRFVNTHLENEASPFIPGEVQSAQAAQLIQTTLSTTPSGVRLIIVGDTNSAPTDPPASLPTPYTLFAAAGLVDIWLLRPGNVSGLSCCQLEDLANRVSALTRRVDLILARERPLSVKAARLIGEVAADRLPPPGLGLWPSDHASVAAGLRY
jgi:endonuclease/exonuclease/phosphatase family metal-dependent hydrolase